MQDQNIGVERRAAERVKTFQLAELVDPAGDCHRVHLLNLSTGGAMAYGKGPAVGQEVSLRGAFAVGAARVAWRRDKCFGLTFAQSLPETSIRRLIDAQRQLVERAAARLRADPPPTSAQ